MLRRILTLRKQYQQLSIIFIIVDEYGDSIGPVSWAINLVTAIVSLYF